MRAEALLDLKNVGKRETKDKRCRLQAVSGRLAESPEKSRFSLLKLMFVIALLSLLGAVGWFTIKNYIELFAIEHVVIDGEFRAEQARDIEAILKPRLTGDLFTVDLSIAHRSITALPWVRDARLQREWPNKIVASIDEQVPIARWGKAALINSEGVVFANIYGIDVTAFPELNGPENSAPDVLAKYAQLKQLLMNSNIKIHKLSVDERNAWTLVSKDNVTIRLGSRKIETRLMRLLSVMNSSSNLKWEQISSIDLRHSNGFAVRKHSTQSNRQG